MYDDIRPYNDIEASQAMKRVAESPYVEKISAFLFPGEDPHRLRDLLSSVSGVDDFQTRIMYNAVKSIIQKTMNGLTYDGLDHFDGGRTYLMLSNHRDIVVDPALIQWILKDNNMPLTEIAAGDNLLSTQLIEDLMRSNRLITVRRDRNPRVLYETSVTLSKYMRERIHGANPASIWIAHRNGRTKDGNDATEQGLLKMISLSGSDDFVENITELSIMPVAISYELESCDIQKAIEVYIKRSTGSYIKRPGEDTQSILCGIMQPKGRVHVTFCEPLTSDEIHRAGELNKNERFRFLAETIDRKQLEGYKLWPVNIAAAQMSRGETPSDKASGEMLKEMIAKKTADLPAGLDPEAVGKVLLEIYATPAIKKGY